MDWRSRSCRNADLSVETKTKECLMMEQLLSESQLISVSLKIVMAHWLAYLLPDPAAAGSIPSIGKKIHWKNLSMLLRFINGAAYRKADSFSAARLVKRVVLKVL